MTEEERISSALIARVKARLAHKAADRMQALIDLAPTLEIAERRERALERIGAIRDTATARARGLEGPPYNHQAEARLRDALAD